MINRVTLVSPYALSVFGGVQEQALAMSRELGRRGIAVQLLAPDSADRTVYDTPAEVVRFGRLLSLPANGSRAPLTLSSRASTQAQLAVEAFGPDVVHFHEPFAPRLGWATLRAHRRPAVATFHRNGEGPALSLTRPLLHRLARHLDATASVSASAAATAARACGVSSEQLFNGFEMERFNSFERRPQDECTLVTVGRLEERKGVAVAIAAVLHHNQTSPAPWRLVVIGDGPQRSSLEALAAGDSRIEFLGAVSDEAKRQWWRDADVALAPALRGESFGMVLLEAMASSTPVVASDIEGYREAAGEHAELFVPGDPLGLCAAVERALQRTPTAIGAAKEHAASWSMSALMDRYLELYERAQSNYSLTR